MTSLTVPQISTPSFYDFVLKSHPTGSSYTCDPPVTTTDIDTIILADTGFAPYLMEEGWMPCSGEQYTDHASNFSAWRKGNLNYIVRSEEHTSELQSLMRISYAVFCLKKKNKNINK